MGTLKENNCKLSPTLAEKLESVLRLVPGAPTTNTFSHVGELASQLCEGSTLKITAVASKKLLLPPGNYLVWESTTDDIILMPLAEVAPTAKPPAAQKIKTTKLLESWQLLEMPLFEDEDQDQMPNEFSEPAPEFGQEGDDGEPTFGGIHTDTVDRKSLLQALKKRDMSVTDVANQCNVNKSTISRLMREPEGGTDAGKGRDPSLALAAKLSSVLKTDVESIFNDVFNSKKREYEQE